MPLGDRRCCFALARSDAGTLYRNCLQVAAIWKYSPPNPAQEIPHAPEPVAHCSFGWISPAISRYEFDACAHSIVGDIGYCCVASPQASSTKCD